MRSAKLIPAALTAIRTSPAPTGGSGRSSTCRTSGAPCLVITTARISITLPGGELAATGARARAPAAGGDRRRAARRAPQPSLPRDRRPHRRPLPPRARLGQGRRRPESPQIPELKRLLHPNTVLRGRVIRATSDQFFTALRAASTSTSSSSTATTASTSRRATSPTRSRTCGPAASILVHDCNPPTAAAASPDPAGAGEGPWCGDVWKAIVNLRATRSDLRVRVLDTDCGIGVIERGESETIELDPACVGDDDLRGPGCGPRAFAGAHALAVAFARCAVASSPRTVATFRRNRARARSSHTVVNHRRRLPYPAWSRHAARTRPQKSIAWPSAKPSPPAIASMTAAGTGASVVSAITASCGGCLGADGGGDDVDAVLAEGVADAADHARLVGVAEHREVVGERHVEALAPDADEIRDVAGADAGSRRPRRRRCGR